MNALRRRPLSRRLLGLVLMALWLAQWAALAHGIAHGQPRGLAATGPAVATAAVAAASNQDAVWGHTAGSAPCHLLDQLLVGQATGGSAPTPPQSDIGAAAPACPQPRAVSRLALRAYEARAPPRV